MANIVPRAGIKPTSLSFWASVLGSLMSALYHSHLSMQLLSSEVSADYYICNKISSAVQPPIIKEVYRTETESTV